MVKAKVAKKVPVKKTKKKVVKKSTDKIKKSKSKLKSNTKKSVKRLSKKDIQKKIRKNAPLAQYFILCNGQRVKNVKELADKMEHLEDDVFDHHANPEKNDFVNWVKDVFKEVELAEKIAEAKNKEHVQLIIYKHIAHKLW